MRYRNQAHYVTLSGNLLSTNLQTGSLDSTTPYSVNVVDIESHMWDDSNMVSRGFKPCVHLSYVVDQLGSSYDVYDPTLLRSPDNGQPRQLYSNVASWYVSALSHRPSSVFNDVGSYIPVTDLSLGYLSDCVFDAYNQYVNSVRSLDASVSIAESGETPRLFELWQRRRAVPSNLVNGFLGYSFGWKPLINDLRAIAKELRSFPKTVRKRLKAIGDGYVTRHYKFDAGTSINDLTTSVVATYPPGHLPWMHTEKTCRTVDKSRTVVVTIRARVKPKLTGDGQDLLNKLGALGLIPSLATIWSVTRLSFVIDWFYNIGGAIENLQGSLTHDISDVSVCISDTRTRSLESRTPNTTGSNAQVVGIERQRYYKREIVGVPILPSLRVPRRPMQYVLLGLLALTNTKRGKLILRGLDGLPLTKNVSSKIEAAIEKLSPRKKANVLKAYGAVVPGFKP